jgi:DNA repair protein SbcD/Mre11
MEALLAFRFVHSADIHLDSPLRSLALLNPELGGLIGGATRQAFQNIVDLCVEERVDALILAGDLYDGDQTSMKTARFFAGQLDRLDKAGIKAFVVRGNHDAESKISAELTYPESAKLFSGRADYVELPDVCGGTNVAIHGISFGKPHAPESLLPKFKPPVSGAINIGIMHTSLTGSDGHNVYAPCKLTELQEFGYRYWALGHIHKRSIFQGDCTIVMPGNPQGRDINEAGSKSATLVTVRDDGSLTIEERTTSVAEFVRIPVSVAGCEDWRSVVHTVRRGLEAARSEAASGHLVGRIFLSGVTPTAYELFAKADLLKAEIDHQAELLGKTWVEKVEIACTAQAAPAAQDSASTIAELEAVINERVLGTESFMLELQGIADELKKGLKNAPRECYGIFAPSDEASFQSRLGELAQEGIREVMARLQIDSSKETF